MNKLTKSEWSTIVHKAIADKYFIPDTRVICSNLLCAGCKFREECDDVYTNEYSPYRIHSHIEMLEEFYPEVLI